MVRRAPTDRRARLRRGLRLGGGLDHLRAEGLGWLAARAPVARYGATR